MSRGNKFGEFWTKMIGVFMNKEAGADEKDQAFHLLAEYVRKNPHRHKREPLPKRPGSLDNDSAILDQLEKSKRSDASKRGLRMFFAWRAAVQKIEGHNAANLAMLLNAVRIYDRLGVEEGALEVENHLRSEFGWDGERPKTLESVREQSARWSMDLEVLSADLRYGERQRAQDDEEDPEDDLSFMGEAF